jgi:hypothetical protein
MKKPLNKCCNCKEWQLWGIKTGYCSLNGKDKSGWQTCKRFKPKKPKKITKKI